jgi:hypothetical protein
MAAGLNIWKGLELHGAPELNLGSMNGICGKGDV